MVCFVVVMKSNSSGFMHAALTSFCFSRLVINSCRAIIASESSYAYTCCNGVDKYDFTWFPELSKAS